MAAWTTTSQPVNRLDEAGVGHIANAPHHAVEVTAARVDPDDPGHVAVLGQLLGHRVADAGGCAGHGDGQPRWLAAP